MGALLAIDPGTTHSGWVLMRDGRVWSCGTTENVEVLAMLRESPALPVAIERFEARGMPIADDSIETVLWTGRMMEAAGMDRVRLVKRSAVKSHICGTQRAKDSNIRQELINRWGGKAEAIGIVKNQGPLYGVKSHAWQALGVAVTALET